ncbi:MAG: DUF4118 domain-containing protein [Acidimicrobiales bacterium]
MEPGTPRGRLRVYLGAAAGVGTTYAMLDEAIRREARGTSVMVGCVVTHGRRFTEERLARLTHGSSAPERLDVDAIVAARPDVVLVDELAHRNPAGAAREHRWQDVEVLLDHGIDVITTLSVQHIDSLADTVREITGRVPDELVPDELLGRTDQIEIVDISPAAIRRRIAHGNVFAPDELQPFDADLFNSDAFAALRALMMFWMADRLAAGPDDPRGARERVVAAVTDSPTADVVLRRAARLAHRSRAPLLGVHVVPTRERDDGAARAARRLRVERLGGTYHETTGDDVGVALLSFAEAEHATQLVLGTAAAPWWSRPFRRTVVEQVLHDARTVDVHVVSMAGHDTSGRRPSMPGTVSFRRRVVAAALGALLLAVLTIVLVSSRDQLSVATALALYLLAVVAITAGGGPWPGLAAAVIAPLLANWYLIPPYHTFRVADGENLLELLVFVSTASIVSWFVSIASRRALEAQRAQREAATLASLTGSGNLELPEVIVEQLRRTFHLDGVAVLAEEGRTPDVLAATGDAPVDVRSADLVAPLASGYVVAATGRPLSPDDHRVLRAFLGQLSRAFEQQRLREIVAEADALARADELRTAMLRAVSHDLRSPLSAIKASVSSLRQPDVDFPPDVRDDFLESIEIETDRLTTIITNLLDMSRLEAGVLRPVLRALSLEEVVPGALHGLGARGGGVVVDLPADLPEVQADPALLERVVANLVGNAVHWSPPDRPVRVRAHTSGRDVQLHVIDHGPGIPVAQRSVVLQPFHRLDDSATGGGLGLGLAIADRLVAVMGGELALRDTPGGGLTVVVVLPSAHPAAAPDRLGEP